MRVVTVWLLTSSSSLVLCNGRPWRSSVSSPILPYVVSKDFSAKSLTNAASSLSLHTPMTSFSGARGGSHSDVDTLGEKTNSIEEETSDDVARGGHSTMTKPMHEEETGSSTDSVETRNETMIVKRGNEGSMVKENKEPTPEAAAATVERQLTRRERRRKKKEQKQLSKSAAKYAKKLKNRNTLNIRRKIMHANFGLGFAALNHFIPRSKFVPGMVVLTSATLVMELLRYRKGFGWMNHALHFVLGSSLRKHEMEGKFTGSFYFFMGVTVTAALYPTTCATLGICQLALADPSASYFGRQTRHVYWSRIEGGLGGFGRNKGVLGFLGGALFCFPFNYRVLSIANFGPGGIPGGNLAVVRAALALGFAGALADLAVPTPAYTLPKFRDLPPLHVDDNFVVPIVSGFCCTQVFSILGWPQDLKLAKYIVF